MNSAWVRLIDVVDEAASFFQVTKVGLVRHLLRTMVARGAVSKQELNDFAHEIATVNTRTTLRPALDELMTQVYREMAVPFRLRMTSTQLDRVADWMTARLPLVQATVKNLNVPSSLNTNASRNLSDSDFQQLFGIFTSVQLDWLHTSVLHGKPSWSKVPPLPSACTALGPFAHVLTMVDRVSQFMGLTKAGLAREALRDALNRKVMTADELKQAKVWIDRARATKFVGKPILKSFIMKSLPEVYKDVKVPTQHQLTSKQVGKLVDMAFSKLQQTSKLLVDVTDVTPIDTDPTRNLLTDEDVCMFVSILTPTQLEWAYKRILDDFEEGL